METLEALKAALCKSLRTELKHFEWLQDYTQDQVRLTIAAKRIDQITKKLERLEEDAA